MTDGTPPTLSRVSWREIMPAVLLFRVPGVAVDAGSVALGTVAVWVLPIGWLIGGLMFLPIDVGPRRGATLPHEGVSALGATAGDPRSYLHSLTRLFHDEVQFQSVFSPTSSSAWSGYAGSLPAKLASAWEALFDLPPDLRTVAYLVFGLIWTAAVMAVFGGSLARRSVVRLGTEQRTGLIDSVRFALRRFGALFTAPLLPALGAAPFAIVLALCGLAMRTDLGLIAGGTLWLLLIAIAFPMTIVAVGGLVGWPLMAPRVMANGTDSFGAVSGAYAYVYGRPWRTIVYALVATLIGFAAIALFDWFIQVLLGLTARGVMLGSSSERLRELAHLGGPASFGVWGYVVGGALVRSTVLGFAFSYFWTAASAIYLLLRLDVDHEEFDHIPFDEELRTLDPRRPDEPARPVGPGTEVPATKAGRDAVGTDTDGAKAGPAGDPRGGATPERSETPPAG